MRHQNTFTCNLYLIAVYFYNLLILFWYFDTGPITVAAQSKARDWSRSLAGTAGSNPAGVMDVLSVVNVVCCADRGLLDGLTPHPGKAYRVFVIECDQVQQ